jgi:hypothetical protein
MHQNKSECVPVRVNQISLSSGIIFQIINQSDFKCASQNPAYFPDNLCGLYSVAKSPLFSNLIMAFFNKSMLKPLFLEELHLFETCW